MSNNMQAFLYKCILRHPNFRKAHYTALGASLEAPTMNECSYIPTTGYPTFTSPGSME